MLKRCCKIEGSLFLAHPEKGSGSNKMGGERLIFLQIFWKDSNIAKKPRKSGSFGKFPNY